MLSVALTGLRRAFILSDEEARLTLRFSLHPACSSDLLGFQILIGVSNYLIDR
jgi:hypothetical protein